MTMQKLWTHLKRELWEHKVGLLWAPTAVALLLMLSFLYMIVTHGYGEHALVGDFDSMHKMEFSDNNSASGEPDEPSETTQSSQDLVDSFMVFGVYALNVVLWLPLAIVLLVYAHGTLFDDRKNREILFWRSMPVSETQNVLTKFFVIGVIAPTIVFLLTFVCMLLLLLSGVVEVWLNTAGGFSELPSFFSLWFSVKVYVGILSGFLVLLPLIAWIIFSSAAAKKSPAMFSSAIPIALVVLDRMANRLLGVDLHLVSMFNRYWDLLRVVGPNEKNIFTSDLMLPFTLAMLVAGLLIMATIWLRNNRYEI